MLTISGMIIGAGLMAIAFIVLRDDVDFKHKAHVIQLQSTIRLRIRDIEALQKRLIHLERINRRQSKLLTAVKNEQDKTTVLETVACKQE